MPDMRQGQDFPEAVIISGLMRCGRAMRIQEKRWRICLVLPVVGRANNIIDIDRVVQISKPPLLGHVLAFRFIIDNIHLVTILKTSSRLIK
ncbi:hypothetical protein NC651_039867 [Populus alba x Populus x berolinensis]|nr:hypothetical protein NC651_039867 [Populus alba x Populus x berolinensis]